MKDDPTFFAMYEGWLPTNFTQGGVNKKMAGEEEGGRCEYYGWGGFGGSIFVWNQEHKMSFAYTCALLHWEDLHNDKGKRLLKEVFKCLKNLTPVYSAASGSQTSQQTSRSFQNQNKRVNPQSKIFFHFLHKISKVFNQRAQKKI